MLLNEPNVYPFSLIIEGGLPNFPINHYDPKVKSLRKKIKHLTHDEYPSPSTIGGVVTALVTGSQRALPAEAGAITPVKDHGVTFDNPNYLISYPPKEMKAFGSLVRYALRDLVLTASASNSPHGNFVAHDLGT